MKTTVYILTNEAMPEIIKVGKATDVITRIKSLYNTSLPLPFECYYAVEVEEDVADKIEKTMHEGLEEERVNKAREFFYASPEKAKSFLKIAEMMGGVNVTPLEIAEEVEDKAALKKAKSKKRHFNFAELGIEPGTTLHFKKDDNYTCEVVNEVNVKYKEEITSLSASALSVVKELGYDWPSAAGPSFWCINGQTLFDYRKENLEE